MIDDRSALINKLDIPLLQRLLEQIYQETRIRTSVVSQSNRIIIQTSDRKGSCMLAGESDAGRHKCESMRMELSRKMQGNCGPCEMHCPFSGLTVTGIPILSEGEQIGMWVMDQVRFEDDPAEAVINRLIGNGISRPVAERYVADAPVMSQISFNMIISFLSVLLEEIVSLASHNLKLLEKSEEYIRLANELKFSMETMQALSDAVDTGVYVVDFYTYEIITCNHVYASFFGKTADELKGVRCYENMGLTSPCEECPRSRLIDADGHPTKPHVWEYYATNFNTWVRCTNRVLRWSDKRLVQMVSCLDITDMKKEEADLAWLAFHDRVLQIPNNASLENELQTNTAYEFLIVLGIEELKSINTLFGRDTGDALLRAIRDYIFDLNIADSVLYRMEVGDFGILLKNTEESIDYARDIAETIHVRCKKNWAIQMDDQRQNLFITADFCVLPLKKGRHYQIRDLNNAIAHTLEMSRHFDSVAIYDDVLDMKFQSELKLEMSLKDAIRDDMAGFSLAYQPIIDPAIGVWYGVEALCRWESPMLGYVPPLDFIPVAEAGGLIGTIGYWVLEQAVSQIKRWGLDKNDRFLLEVNLSPLQLSIPNLAQIIIEILEKYEYPPEKLCLEVTESSELNFTKHTMGAIERLSGIGVVIALDDFGTGYSSFNTLHKLPVKVLKTDRSFIDGVESDDHLQHLLFVMVELAHSSDMKIIVEGVETEKQARILLKQGADYFQGYFFSRPLNSGQMEALLHNFTMPSAMLVSMRYDKLDLTRNIQEYYGYDLTLSQYKMLNQCLTDSIACVNEDAAILNILARVGENLKVSRTYVFLKEADGTYTNTHEWCGVGVTSQIKSLRHMNVEGEWINALVNNGIIAVSDTANLSDAVYAEMARQGIKAILVFPIWRNNEVCGFAGFDICDDIHNWSREEILMLHKITGVITSMLMKNPKYGSNIRIS